MKIDNLELAKCFVTKAENSKKRGIEFNMSLANFANLKAQTHCAYSGLPFNDHSEFSFERIDNEVGYIDGNVIPVLRSINSARGSYTLENIDARLEQLGHELRRLTETQLKFIDQRKTSVEKMIAAQERDKNAKKRRIPHKMHLRFLDLMKQVKIRQDRIDHRKGLIDELKTKKNTKHKKSLMDTHTKKLEAQNLDLLSWTQKATAFVNNFQETNIPLVVISPRAIKYKNHIALVDKQLENIPANIERTRELIAQTEIVKVGLQKFSNLSEAQKSRLVLGVPLETPTFKLLKHKVGYNLIITSM